MKDSFGSPVKIPKIRLVTTLYWASRGGMKFRDGIAGSRLCSVAPNTASSSRGISSRRRETVTLVNNVPVTHMPTAKVAATYRLAARVLNNRTSILGRLNE